MCRNMEYGTKEMIQRGLVTLATVPLAIAVVVAFVAVLATST